MTERQFLIAFDMQLGTIAPQYNITAKIDSDTIFHYLNNAKDEYIKQNYRLFQRNQEISDNIRTLVVTNKYTSDDFTHKGREWRLEYPEDYVFALGEKVYISIKNNSCPGLITKETDVLEATIENVDSKLNNSLSEHRLHHNQARPIRVYTDNQIVLYTDGNYNINNYSLTYLRKAKDLGTDLLSEYTELPELTHQNIVDAAVATYIQHATLIGNKKNTDEK